MVLPSTTEHVLDRLGKSGLIEPATLESWMQRQVGSDTLKGPEALAEALVRDRLLTPFQAKLLLAGKSRGFVVSGRYVVLDALGIGGMGTVFLCQHRVMRHQVALKVLPRASAREQGALERFHREARAVAALNHPNIVRALEMDHDGDLHYLVLEYVEGITLHDLVKQHGPLDPVRAAHYIAQAALGLQHAHEAGLVHRDIKPANLLLDRAGVVKILDMGLARFFNDDADQLTQKHESSRILGTADYLAPEQAVNSHDVDIRADIYSLGATFYYLLAGHAPFHGRTVAEKMICHQMRTPDPIRAQRPEVPAPLAAVIDRMMAKPADQRFSVPSEVVEALFPWIQEPIAPPTEQELPPRRGAQPSSSGSGSWPGAAATPSGLMTLPGTPAAWAKLRAPEEAPTAVLAGQETATSGAEKKPATAAAATLSGTAPRTSARKPVPWMAFVAAGLGVLIVAGGVAMWLNRSGPPPESVAVTASPAPAREPPPRFAPPVSAPVLTDHERFVQAVAGLSPEEQVKAVARRLKELNPDFKGNVTLKKIEDGRVRAIVISPGAITDLSPVQVLSDLDVLTCAGAGKERIPLSDLTPLKGLRLSNLNCSMTDVNDLSPLRDMPLRQLALGGSKVHDLTPLRGMKMESLTLWGAPIRDLTPLQGMPLRVLSIHGCRQVTDLTPLKDLPLENLSCGGTSVTDHSPLHDMRRLKSLDILGSTLSDLSPLRGLSLERLMVPRTRVQDLTPLKGMPLKFLDCRMTPLTDLTPLTELSELRELKYEFNRERDGDLLRKLKNLEIINGEPASQVLRRAG